LGEADAPSNQASRCLHRKIVGLGRSSKEIKIVPLTRGGAEMRTQRCCFFLFVFTAALFTGAAFPQAQNQAQAKSESAKALKPAARAASGQISPNDASSRLPVKRVVLYKNGVGYFEHSARVRGNQELAIDFTTAQLNDVLKSLTVVDLGDGRISGVRYNSIAPLDERLKTLRLPFGEQVTRTDFLTAMRGSRVEVRGGSSSATGRLLSVEQEQRTTEKGTSYQVTEFSVTTDSGEMKNFELGPAVSVRLAERDLNQEVGRYLDLVGSSRAKDLRRMSISATGSGDRDIFVSYISEVPVWKSTYRIILPEKAGDKPLLQGWAIVDNTIGEDWNGVQLSLIAGAPQSFIQDISQPYYARRPVVALPQSLMLTPQTHEGTLNREFDRLEQFGKLSPGVAGPTAGANSLRGVVTDLSGAVVAGAQVTVRNEQTGASQSTTTDARGIYQFYNVPTGNSALFVNSPGFKAFNLSNFFVGAGRSNEINARLEVGASSETVEVMAQAATLNTESAEVGVRSAISKQHVEAEGKDLGDYFEYNLKQKITIGKNQSALVPILQAHIEAEKVSIWEEESKEIRRALWITNSSDETLDSGTFNILDGDAFAGEGVLETIHPAEKRLISYASDPALRIAMDQESSDKPFTRIRIAKGSMYLTHEQREVRKYTLHNSDTAPRQVVIEHPVREEWKLAPGPKPEETSESYLRFRVAVGPGKTETMQIEEVHPEDSEYELSNLDDKQVAVITQQKQITPALQEAFRRILSQKNVVGGLEDQIKAHQSEVDAIGKDQARLRENMKALKGSSEERTLLLRYTKQLDSQEDRLGVLKQQIDDLSQRRDAEQQKLDDLMEQMTLDESF
jgi:hypothetical protein